MRSINTVDELLSLSKTDIVELTSDIDCQGRHIPKICSIFRGTLEGNNHTISNLVIDDPIWGDEQKLSLFSYLTHASIKNIRFENITFLIDKGVYSPKIAGLCTNVADSILDNVTVNVLTSNGEDIPMIYDSVGGTDNNLVYTCNNENYKIYKYKEGL